MSKSHHKIAECTLNKHRESIDRLDAIIIYALGERFKHTKTIGKLKAKYKLPVSDPDREASLITRLQHLAIDAGVDPAFATKLINFIIEEVIQHHNQHKNQPSSFDDEP